MSIESWKRDFFPEDTFPIDPIDALRHSMRKWRGLSRKYLLRHDLLHENGLLFDPENEKESFPIDGTTCALCHIYMKEEIYSHATTNRCAGCPIVEARHGVACDDRADGESLSPYHMFIERSDHRTMLMWLNKAFQTATGEDIHLE